MITISGLIHDFAVTPFTDKETGVITDSVSVEILHKQEGKSIVTPLRLEPSTVESWRKCKGRDILPMEVKAWALPGFKGGSPKLGYSFADKKALPVFVNQKTA